MQELPFAGRRNTVVCLKLDVNANNAVACLRHDWNDDGPTC